MDHRTEADPSRPALRRAVLTGLFVGTLTAVGYLLSGVPGVELMTLTAALAGGVLGVGGGALCGALGAGAYSLASPYGPALPPLLAAQVVGMAAAGALGGLAAPGLVAARRAGRRGAAALQGALLGTAATLLYDALTTAAMAWAFGQRLPVAFGAGAPLALLHLGTNLPAFALVLPAVLPRFRLLARSRLRGGGGRAGVAAALLLGLAATAAPARAAPAVASADSAAAPAAGAADTLAAAPVPGAPAPPAAAGPVPPPGSRPLWHPFAADVVELLDRRTPLVPVRDGGLGASLVLLDEAGTSPWPRFLRDGLPLGTGHRWADSPWLVATAGLALTGLEGGLDGWGGTDGAVVLAEAGGRGGEMVADTRWFKGDHETYLRYLALRTPDAPWRLRFDFQENLDQLGYDQTPGGRFDAVPRAGESKFRSGRGTLTRQLADGSAATLEVETIRQHKTALPVLDVRHREVWGDRAAVTWRQGTAAGRLRASLFWTQRDVQDTPADGALAPRKLESRRDGALLLVAGRRGWLRGEVLGWRVADTGADSLWAHDTPAGAFDGAVLGRGVEAGLGAGVAWSAGPVGGEFGGGARWAERGGWLGEVRLAARPAAGRAWWRLTLEGGGRAPRSDELLTAWRVVGPDGTPYLLLPDGGLGRERTLRAAGRLAWRPLGLDLALEGSLRRLRDGIGWRPLGGTAGRWTNDLELDSAELVASLARRARLLGWLQLRAQSVWRAHDLRAGTPLFLPPERSSSLEVLWEARFFEEDGILEIGYLLQHRGPTDDPWLPGAEPLLPALTRQDLILGFRLVGTDLSLELRNLTDERAPVSAGAVADGRELRWRLHWTFAH